MKLVPKRKQISGTEKPTIIIQQAADAAQDTIGGSGGITDSVVAKRGWFTYRLRIPVGTDMYG